MLKETTARRLEKDCNSPGPQDLTIKTAGTTDHVLMIGRGASGSKEEGKEQPCVSQTPEATKTR